MLISDIKTLIDLDNNLSIRGYRGVDCFLELVKNSTEDVALVITAVHLRRGNRFENLLDFSRRIEKYITVSTWNKIPLLWDIVVADDILAVVASQKQSYNEICQNIGVNFAIVLITLSAGRKFHREEFAHGLLELRVPLVFSDIQHIVPEDHLQHFSLRNVELVSSLEMANNFIKIISRSA